MDYRRPEDAVAYFWRVGQDGYAELVLAFGIVSLGASAHVPPPIATAFLAIAVVGCLALFLRHLRWRTGFEALLSPGLIRLLGHDGRVRTLDPTEVTAAGPAGIAVTARNVRGDSRGFNLVFSNSQQRDRALNVLRSPADDAGLTTPAQELAESGAIPARARAMERGIWLAGVPLVALFALISTNTTTWLPVLRDLRRSVGIAYCAMFASIFPWNMALGLGYGEEGEWCWAAPVLRGASLPFRKKDIVWVAVRGWYTYVIGHGYWYVTFGPPGRTRRFAAFLAERAGLEEVRLPGP
ncbi:MAG: hypothetical protein HUU35_12040 [Armatimonadetes bacterium]|nr:hypothetical protein [Armatimonadota bacterium]